MNNTKFCTFIIFLVFSGVLSAQSELKMFQKIYDFGLVMEGEKPTHLFEFENIGDDTLRIVNVRPSCGCTAPNWPEQPFGPGESDDIRVTYNSTGRVGPFYKTITVTTNKEQEEAVLIIKGIVVQPETFKGVDSLSSLNQKPKAGLAFKKTSFQLGQTELGRPVKEYVEVKNTSTAPIELNYLSAGCYCVDIANKQKIEPGKTLNLELSHTAKHMGEYSDKAVLFTTDEHHPVYELEFFYTPNESLKTQSKSLLQQNTQPSGFGF